VREAVRQRLEAIDDPRELVEKAITGVRADEVDLASVKDASLADVMEAGGETRTPSSWTPSPTSTSRATPSRSLVLV
jgi:arginine deiminase